MKRKFTDILLGRRVLFFRGTGGAAILGASWYSTKKVETSKSSIYSLNCGVSCLAKQSPFPAPNAFPSNIKFDCCGEDSFCIAENNHQVVIAVADGVGSWRSKGIDPSAFSRSLMRHLEKEVMGFTEEKNTSTLSALSSSLFSSGSPQEVKEVLPVQQAVKNAFWRMVRSFGMGKEKPFGSSTVSLVSLDKNNGVMEGGNLGDSGFIVVRDGQIVERSTSQQHYFNCPFQLTIAPGGNNISDTTNAMEVKNVQLKGEDLIVLGTDGLWDNLFEEDVLNILRRETLDVKGAAESLVREARRKAVLEDYETPFSRESQKHGRGHRGGKLDDITVIVALVQKNQDQS